MSWSICSSLSCVTWSVVGPVSGQGVLGPWEAPFLLFGVGFLLSHDNLTRGRHWHVVIERRPFCSGSGVATDVRTHAGAAVLRLSNYNFRFLV